MTANVSTRFRAALRRLLPLLLAVGIQGHAAAPAYRLQSVATGLNYPWNIAFLPDGDRLVTELGGQLLRIAPDGAIGAPIEGVPPVYRASQGGLFDVLPDPDFAGNRLIYLSYAAGDKARNATTVVRARLENDRLHDTTVLFSATPKKSTPVHYGGRLAWLPDGTLLLTIGDGWEHREDAQRVTNHFGKTIRMQKDGSPATDNPFPRAPYVWTYGHRNPQGLAVNTRGVVFQHEHGPRGGDEVNLLVPGRNYGWPAVTHGVDYNGALISPYTEYPGMEQPVHVWVPSIAPSGLMIYEGNAFPEWRGDLFVSALVDKEVRRLDVTEGRVTGEEALFSELDCRIRDVRQAPDGSIYLITDGRTSRANPNAGSIFRVEPAD